MLGKGINKIKQGVTQAGHVNLHIRALVLARFTLVIGRAMTLLSWLRTHPWRSVPHVVAPKELKDKKALERFP